MLNPFVLKKYAAVLFPAFLSTILFIVGNVYYGFWGGFGFFAIGVILSILLDFFIFLKNPFSDMLEGKGLLAFDISSTGIIKPFLLNLDKPYMKGKVDGKEVEDIFNRQAVHTLTPPKKPKKAIIKENELIIEQDEEQLNSNRFGFFHIPVLLYNSQIKSFITKDFFAERERDNFAEHGILYLNAKTRELSSDIKNFGRHVIELTRPAQSMLKNPWVMVIGIILLVILGLALAPEVIEMLRGTFSGGAEALKTATGNGAITPRG